MKVLVTGGTGFQEVVSADVLLEWVTLFGQLLVPVQI